MKRVLIIDDDPSIRLLYQEELLEEGYDAISSDGKKNVLQLIAEKTPDLVLLDFKLGNRNGLDLLQDIRKELRTTPVILLTASPAFKFDSRTVPAQACVTKNSDLTELKQQIEKHLRGPESVHKLGAPGDRDLKGTFVKPAVQLGMRFHE